MAEDELVEPSDDEQDMDARSMASGAGSKLSGISSVVRGTKRNVMAPQAFGLGFLSNAESLPVKKKQAKAKETVETDSEGEKCEEKGVVADDEELDAQMKMVAGACGTDYICLYKLNPEKALRSKEKCGKQVTGVGASVSRRVYHGLGEAVASKDSFAVVCWLRAKSCWPRWKRSSCRRL